MMIIESMSLIGCDNIRYCSNNLDTVLSRGESNACHFTFSSSFRGGQSGRKEDTKILNLHSFFSAFTECAFQMFQDCSFNNLATYNFSQWIANCKISQAAKTICTHCKLIHRAVLQFLPLECTNCHYVLSCCLIVWYPN